MLCLYVISLGSGVGKGLQNLLIYPVRTPPPITTECIDRSSACEIFVSCLVHLSFSRGKGGYGICEVERVCLSACLAVCLSACTFPPSLSRCPGNCQVLDCATPDTMFEELLGCRDQTSLINFSFFSAPDPKLSLRN